MGMYRRIRCASLASFFSNRLAQLSGNHSGQPQKIPSVALLQVQLLETLIIRLRVKGERLSFQISVRISRGRLEMVGLD